MQLDREKTIEFGAGVVGLVAMAGLVYANTISVDVAVPIALAILGGIMSYESGRRKGHRNSEQPPVAQLVTTVLEQIDNLPDPNQSSQPTTDPDAQSHGSGQPPTDESSVPVGEHVEHKIKTADYRTLQKVAGRLDHVNGSATRTTITKQLYHVDPETVLDAFAAVEDGGDGS